MVHLIVARVGHLILGRDAVGNRRQMHHMCHSALQSGIPVGGRTNVFEFDPLYLLRPSYGRLRLNINRTQTKPCFPKCRTKIPSNKTRCARYEYMTTIFHNAKPRRTMLETETNQKLSRDSNPDNTSSR
jgi:hypothetical protein